MLAKFMLALLLSSPLTAADAKLDKQIASLVQRIEPELIALAMHPDVIADIKAQNLKPLSPTQAQKIQTLWLSKKVEDLEKVQVYIKNRTAEALKATMKKIPLSKCFTMDKQGNIAGTEPKCHDFIHGDQPKFSDCFKSGKMVVNKPAKDLSSGKFSVQISMPVKDKKETIGVLVATFPLEIN